MVRDNPSLLKHQIKATQQKLRNKSLTSLSQVKLLVPFVWGIGIKKKLNFKKIKSKRTHYNRTVNSQELSFFGKLSFFFLFVNEQETVNCISLCLEWKVQYCNIKYHDISHYNNLILSWFTLIFFFRLFMWMAEWLNKKAMCHPFWCQQTSSWDRMASIIQQGRWMR